MAVTIGDNLTHFRADSQFMLRLAIALGATALVMLSVTLWRAAGGDALPEQINAAPPVLSTSLLPLEPEAVAPTWNCPHLRNGKWLRLAIYHQPDVGIAYHDCIYEEAR